MAPVKLDFHPEAIIVEKVVFAGDVKIGKGTVVHPAVEIKATNGNIIIGDYNNIEEKTLIENLSTETMIIGNGNTFEVGCTFKGRKMGEQNILSVNSYIGEGVTISDMCSIGMACRVIGEQELLPSTVVFGENNERRIQLDKPQTTTEILEFLTKILPKYQKLMKTD
uniref:Dynactin subunit 6 n=1 Tax=Rhabditophanes sp. KR3021 TaxID=114890 RepID=A0AC35TTQ8_9BILA